MSDEEPRGHGVIAIVGAVGGAIVWMLVTMVTGYRLQLLAIVIAGVVGSLMRPAVRSTADYNVPVRASLLAMFAILLGEYLSISAVAKPLGASLGMNVTLPLGVSDFFYLLASTMTRITLGMYAAAAGAAYAFPSDRLRKLQQLENEQLAREDMADLDERIARVEAMPKPKSIGGARVRCNRCDEMVDAATTIRDASAGIVCADCATTLEGEQNAGATYRG